MNELPMEILLKIISYLPDNKAMALVNRRCYDAVCFLDAPLMCLGMFPSRNHNKQFIKSIMATTRKVRNIMVSFQSVQRPIIIDVLKKFGEDIDYLRVGAGKAADLIEAIELAPSVAHLELVCLSNGEDSEDSEDDDDAPPSKKVRQYDDNEVLNLLQLKKLNIERCACQFLVIFNRLPAGGLVELTLHEKHLYQLAKLFRIQTNLKKVAVFKDEYSRKDPTIDEDIFDALQIESLEWHNYSSQQKNIRTILSKQVKLKTLKLIGGHLSSNSFNVITSQLNELQTLSIGVSDIPVSAVKSISNLVNLKELTMESQILASAADRFKEFATLDNSRITTLNIQHHDYLSNDVIHAMAKSLPNLKHVSFHCDYNINTFHAILKSFNYVESLHLDTQNIMFDCKERKGSYTTLMKQGCENERLTELKICYPISYSVKIVEKLVLDYPHLKKLVILPPATPTNRTLCDQLKVILTGFTELESLTILRDSSSIDRRWFDLDSIVEYGINLKFVALLDMDASLQHIEKRLRYKKRFGVIEYSRYEGLVMADGRKTMKMEWKSIEQCRHY